MWYFAYNALSLVVFAAGALCMPFLWLLGERFTSGLAQRLGWYPKALLAARAPARPLWIHAASVGEVLSAAALLDELKKRFPERPIILSTFTHTGNRIARRATRADVVFFLPLDFFWIVRRALDVFDPLVLIITETELWPNLLREARKRGVPCLLVSGRLSERAFRRYRTARALFRCVVANFAAIGMQTEVDAARIIALGAPRERVSITGNLKRAVARVPGSAKPAREGARRMLVAGSSHPGEEEILLDAFSLLKRAFPDLQMVLAPRHPERFDDVEKLLRARGFGYRKQSEADGRPAFDRDILFLDTLGDLREFYAQGDVAFVGGSLIDAGGHNLLEPAQFRKPVLFGPFTGHFRALAAEMKRQGGGFEVQGASELAATAAALLGDPERCRSAGERAYRIAVDESVLERSAALVCRYVQV
ncbi:MAG TPA: 3-deoxy-D-manno-octulosonic acid transferase [Candidatus Eisenbacteria bacterium]|nr:3-deoxy-D-manno-octulosonic acid transferase [Candidatus Eisenbacteria bacterium]